MSGAGNEFEDFFLPAEVDYSDASVDYEYPARPVRANFFAWHRPRKQYIREKQWSNALLEIMQDRAPEERIKYIGLPGIDLLDIRQFIRHVCTPSSRKIQFIGFDLAAGSDSSGGTELNISLGELNTTELVHQPSNVRPDDLRYIGKRTTNAWQAVRGFGHVDIVNFDLTKTVFDGAADSAISYLAALREILSLQAGNPNPWVLLLTTKVDRQDMVAEAVEPLLGRFRSLLDECPELLEAVELAGLSAGAGTATDGWDDDSLRVSSLTAAVQWMRNLLNEGALSARVRLTSSFIYTSFEGGDSADVASLVIRFDHRPTDLIDTVFASSGVLQTEPSASDCTPVVRDFKRIAGSADIDSRLSEDPELRAAMLQNAAELMSEARYSREAFEQWANSQPS